MISTFNFVKHLRRYATDHRILQRVLSSELREAFNRRTYHQLYVLGEIRKLKSVVEETNVVITFQTLTNIRSFSSATENGSGNEMVVKHDPGEGKFYVDVAGVGIAYIEYDRNDELIIIKHTEVSKELGGRGIGKILAKEALEYVARNDLQLEIKCSFVRNYVCKYEPKYIKYIQK